MRAVQRERRDVDLEALAGLGDHLVAPGHETRSRRKRYAARILEALAGAEHRLLADHAFAPDLLPATRCIGDDPVSRAQLHRFLAGVGDHDGVGPEILALV